MVMSSRAGGRGRKFYVGAVAFVGCLCAFVCLLVFQDRENVDVLIQDGSGSLDSSSSHNRIAAASMRLAWAQKRRVQALRGDSMALLKSASELNHAGEDSMLSSTKLRMAGRSAQSMADIMN